MNLIFFSFDLIYIIVRRAILCERHMFSYGLLQTDDDVFDHPCKDDCIGSLILLI